MIKQPAIIFAATIINAIIIVDVVMVMYIIGVLEKNFQILLESGDFHL